MFDRKLNVNSKSLEQFRFVVRALQGGDLSTPDRASYYVEFIYNVASRPNPVAVYKPLYFVSCQTAVSDVFASYPHPGGQGLAEP